MIDEIFANGRYDLPIELGKNDMQDGVSNLLTSYIHDLEAKGVDIGVIKKVRQFRKSCAHTLRNYLKGTHTLAYENFSKAVSILGIDKSLLLSSELGSEPLFRGRINSGSTDFSDDEMFHVPLNKRGIVESQRYSFPGLPCLYLATSAYTCWAEMGRPSLDSFQVALLRPKDTGAKVVDLSRIPQQLNTFRNEPWFSENEYLLYWPLLAVCSIKVQNEEDPFKPEYIFPQFYLEHIQQNKNEHVGIRYASIKCKRQLKSDWHTFTNYVFPTSTSSMKIKDDERLRGLFEIIRNRSGKELQIVSSLQRMDWARTKIDHRPTETDKILAGMNNRRIVTADGKEYPYSISPFGMIELALLREEFDIDEVRTTIETVTEDEIDELINVVFNQPSGVNP